MGCFDMKSLKVCAEFIGSFIIGCFSIKTFLIPSLKALNSGYPLVEILSAVITFILYMIFAYDIIMINNKRKD